MAHCYVEGKVNISKPVSASERESVESFFPPDELPLHLVFKTDAREHSKSRRDVIAAASPHWIKLFTTSKQGTCKPYFSLHISEIEQISNADRTFACLHIIDGTKVTFNAPESLELAQIVYRNYSLIYQSFPNLPQITLSVSKKEQFPDIITKLSPSQRFQFLYSSMCSKYQISYNHDVVRYFHQLILSKNTIIDMSQLPETIDPGKPEEIIALFYALQAIGYAFGICCENVKRPNLLTSLAPILGEQEGSGIRIIYFAKFGMNGGVKQVAESVKISGGTFVQYWDLHENPELDVEYFPELLSYSRKPVVYLDLSGCNLSEQTCGALFTTLADSPYLRTLSYLKIGGAKLDKLAVEKFRHYLEVMISTEFEDEIENNKGKTGKSKKCHLIGLDLTGVIGGERAVAALHDLKVPLKELSVANCQFIGEALDILIKFVQFGTLMSLDISGTKMTPLEVEQVIYAVYQCADGFSLKLNNLNLHGASLMPILRALFTNFQRPTFSLLSLDNNGLGKQDAADISTVLGRLARLDELSISGNFKHNENDKDLAHNLPLLLKNPTLKRLTIRGSPNAKCGPSLIPLIELALSKHLEAIDISNNNCGRSVVPLILSLANPEYGLKEISFDGNGLAIEDIDTTCSAIGLSEIKCPFPIIDARSILEQTPPAARQTALARLGGAQQCLSTPLPFPSPPPVPDLLGPGARGAVGNARRHSLSCALFGLPLPFAAVGSPAPADDRWEDGDDGGMAAYGSDSLWRYYNEPSSTSPSPDGASAATQQLSLPPLSGGAEESDDRSDSAPSHSHPSSFSDSESISYSSSYSEIYSDDFVVRTPPPSPASLRELSARAGDGGERRRRPKFSLRPYERREVGDDSDPPDAPLAKERPRRERRPPPEEPETKKPKEAKKAKKPKEEKEERGRSEKESEGPPRPGLAIAAAGADIDIKVAENPPRKEKEKEKRPKIAPIPLPPSSSSSSPPRPKPKQPPKPQPKPKPKPAPPPSSSESSEIDLPPMPSLKTKPILQQPPKLAQKTKPEPKPRPAPEPKPAPKPKPEPKPAPKPKPKPQEPSDPEDPSDPDVRIPNVPSMDDVFMYAREGLGINFNRPVRHH